MEVGLNSGLCNYWSCCSCCTVGKCEDLQRSVLLCGLTSLCSVARAISVLAAAQSSAGYISPRCCAELHVFLGPSRSLLPGRWAGRAFRPAHVVISCSVRFRNWER